MYPCLARGMGFDPEGPRPRTPPSWPPACPHLYVKCAGADAVSANYIPDFPYKPESYFLFPWWLIGSALGFSVAFCVIGAFLPARRAARMQPAAVLSGH